MATCVECGTRVKRTGSRCIPCHHRARAVSPIDRFLAKVKHIPSGCWEWTGYLEEGYGRFWYEGRMGKAYRFSYEHYVGPIPLGLTIDHLCANPSCVNPSHLEAVTQGENSRRSPNTIPSKNAARTHCPHGHPYDEENTLTYRGHRICRTCRRGWQRRRRARQRAAQMGVAA